MALGSNYSGGIPNYIGMADDAGKSGLNEARSMTSMLGQGYKLGTQMADRTRRDQARKTFGDAWASGDPKQIERAMQLFPEFAQQAQQFIGIRDEQHRKDTGSLMAELSSLADAGDYQGALNLVNQSGNTLDGSAQGTLQKMLSAAIGGNQNAQQRFGNMTKSMMLTALTPAEQANWQNAQQRIQLDALRERETEQRDQWMHQDRVNQQSIAMYRLEHPRSLGLNRDHSSGLRGPELAKYIVENGVMPDGTLPTAEAAQWAAQAAMQAEQKANPGKKISINSPDQKANMAGKQALQDYQRRNKAMTDAIGKTAQADARLNSLNTTTPIGQLAAEFQFLTVEAPTIGNNVATASGVSAEAVHGWVDKINQIRQEWANNGSLTDNQVKELKEAASQEYHAIKDLQLRSAESMASQYDLSDPITAATVRGTTGYVPPTVRGSSNLDVDIPPVTAKTLSDDDKKKLLNKYLVKKHG